MRALTDLVDLDPAQRRRLGVVAAVAFAALVAAIALIADVEEEVGAIAFIDVAIAIVGCGVLFFRWHQPVLVAVVAVAMRLLHITISDTEIALVGAVAVAFYTLARSGDRRWVFAAATATALGTTFAILGVDANESFPQELLGELAAVLLPAVYGGLARSQEQRVASAIEAEARTRVQAERLRIARDLHDIVAHGLATIAVQSGTAEYNLPGDDPQDPVRVALGRINQVGKKSLEDLRAMVGVLRSTDTPEHGAAPLRPAPTDPSDFSELVESAGLADIELTLDIEGPFPDGTSDATIVAAHRIAQEAVTNVARHAGAVEARLQVRYGDTAATLRVVNSQSARPEPAVPSTGVGIIGMTERAESLGGSLEAKPLNGGGFEVRAVLPYQPGES